MDNLSKVLTLICLSHIIEDDSNAQSDTTTPPQLFTKSYLYFYIAVYKIILIFVNHIYKS